MKKLNLSNISRFNIRVTLLVSIFLFNCSFVFAQNDGAGNTGLSFLKLGVTSRALSLGEAVVSSTNDASAVFYNPSALVIGSKVNLLFMHDQHVMGVRSEFLAGKVALKKFAFGFSAASTSVDDIELREIPGNAIDLFNSRNFALTLSGAYKISDNMSIGVSGKFLYEKIYIDNASGFAFDAGASYFKDKIKVGICVANFGSMTELRSQSTKLPSSIRGGVSYSIILTPFNSNLIISADGYKVLDGGKAHLNAGAELLYKDFLSIRAGYQSGYENKFITTGLGLKYKGVNLDYAFVPYKFSEGSSHTITLGVSF